MEKGISIIKIGGATLASGPHFQQFCETFAAMDGKKILVHGGGTAASRLGERLGVPPVMVDGRRVTDQDTLEIAVMTYAGWANKSLVAALQARGCPALGVSGADADLIRAIKRPATSMDYGFVGDITSVHSQNFEALMELGLVPVCCALTHDGAGQLLNTNADTIAAEIAIALAEKTRVRLWYCFDKPGVLENVGDDSSLIPEMDRSRYEKMKAAGKIAQGMLPKLHNCFDAMSRGVDEVAIGSPEMLQSTKAPRTKIRL